MAEHTVQDVVNGTQSTGTLPVDVPGHTQSSTTVVVRGNDGDSNTPSNDSAIASSHETSASATARIHESAALRERANSFKRPKTFQTVSVTKTFLGKNAPPEAQRASDKNATIDHPSALSRASPQPSVQKKTLNLKTGSSSRIATAHATTPASGPDAAKVWNRNQPVAPPPPKQFTDEELKQQYGIHLATRLQADESGTQSKWADIDDDDDSWVPDGVMEWTDGTKSSLAPVKTPPEPVDAAEEDLRAQAPSEVAKDATLATAQPTASGAGKTILRPGIRSSTSGSGKPGLVLRGQPESTQNAIPGSSTSGNGRSPWAALPPVDKVSPVTFVPPTQAGPRSHRARRPSQDYDTPAPYQPTRELAADDFSRWADGERQSKELYNSQSGRYEPVRSDGRRSSLRPDGYRRPSVLQRPTNGPYPESSAAFQGRRGDARADGSSQWQHGDESAIASTPAEVGSSDLQSSSQSLHRRQSVASSEAPKAPSVPEVPLRTAEEERAEQHRLMKERIELNRRRKIEEQEREDEARKERVRLKMKALEEKEAAAKALERSRQTEEKAASAPASKQPSPPASRTNEDTPQSFSVKPPSDPLPPREPHLTPPKSPKVVLAPPILSSSSGDLPKSKSHEGLKSHVSGGSSPHSFEQDMRSWTQLANRHPPSGWPGTSMPGQASSAGNVWGPPSNDRTLGNGVFESGTSSLQRSPNRALQRSGPPPGPIGPPIATPRVPPESTQFQGSPPPGMGSVNMPPSSGSSSVRYSGPSSKSNTSGRQKADLSAVTRAWGNAQAARAHQEAERSARRAARAAELAEDPNAPEKVPVFNVVFKKTEGGKPGREEQVLIEDQNKVRLGESEPGFLSGPPGPLALQATAQAPIGSLPSGQTAHHSRFFGPNAQPRPSPAVANYRSGSPSPPPPEVYGHPAFDGLGGPRPRVNFPPGKPTIRLPPNVAYRSTEPAHQSVVGVNNVIMPSRSTPGAYGGPKPIVQQAAWQDRFNDLFGRGTSSATAPPAATGIAGPSVTFAAPSAAIASASRVPLEAASGMSGASVVLPREKARVTFSLPDIFIESKPNEEEMMEDRGFGSLPTVSLPTDVPVVEAMVTPRGGGKVAQIEKSFTFGSTSDVKEVNTLLDGQQGNQVTVVVHMLGMPEVVKTLPRKYETGPRKKARSSSNPKRKVSASGSAQASDFGSGGQPSPPNEKENGERRSKWAKHSKRASRGPDGTEQQKSPTGLGLQTTGKGTVGGSEAGKHTSGTHSSKVARGPKRVTSRAP